MRITIPGFEGVNSLLAPQRIKETEAVDATDCDFRSGDLRGYLDDVQTGTTSSHDINGVTIFDYSPTQELITNGNWDIVRSPVANDKYKRCYYSEYAPDDTTKYVSVIDSTNISDLGGGLSYLSSTTRLGVPKPAPFLLAPTYEIRQGDILGTVLSTSSDSKIYILNSLAGLLKKQIKLVVSSPGFPSSGLTITDIAEQGDGDTTLAVITLSGNKKTWKNCDVVKTTVSSGTGSGSTKTTTISFKLAGHGLITGDQVVVSLRKSGMSWPVRYPSGTETKLWSVTVIDPNSFSLDGLSPTANDTAAGTQSFSVAKFSLLAAADVAFSDPDSMVLYHQSYQTSYMNFPGSGASVGTWVDAAAIDTLRSRSYCITFVNKYGEESAPSTPTDPFDVVPGAPVTFPAGSFLITSGIPDYSMNNVADLVEVRLYRTDETGTFRLVTVDSLTTDYSKYNIIRVYRSGSVQLIQNKSDGNIFVDTLTDAQLGEPLMTTGWYPPPQGVQGIISAPNGVIVGFKGKTVYASVPYIPCAYPIAYQLATDTDIMGLVATASGIAILTKQMPYMLIGSDPSSWSMVKLEVPAACVSHASIVDMGSFGIYAGPDGLMAINGAEVRNLTQDMLTRAQWQGYNPSTIIGGHSEGRYVGSYLDGGSRKAFIFDTISNDFVDLTLSAVGFYTDLYTDTLKFVDVSGSVKQWNRGTTTKSYFWKSKVFQLPLPSLFGAVQVVAYSYPVTFKLYDYDTNTQIGSTVTVTASNPFRLPSGKRYQNLQITLEGTGSVATVAVASTIDELKEV